jgi:ectoine hydroxylase-related dioxygenase (phytanoyl-CoA dioxygenase family)
MELNNFKYLSHSALKSLNIEEINSKLDNDGFCIIKNLISDEIVDQLKSFWEEEFKKQLNVKPNINSVRGNLHLGEQDFESYSDNSEWNIFRSFSFYWNVSKSKEHKVTKTIAAEINCIRNLVEGNNILRGVNYDETCYGIYLSVSHYPPSKGFLKLHNDGHPDKGRLLQYMVNINRKNVDYFDGGLYLEKDGKRIDVDSMLDSGSVIFFDGAHGHGVSPVKSKTEIGRLAFFAIPTYFVRKSDIPPFVRKLEKAYLGIKRRISK